MSLRKLLESSLGEENLKVKSLKSEARAALVGGCLEADSGGKRIGGGGKLLGTEDGGGAPGKGSTGSNNRGTE